MLTEIADYTSKNTIAQIELLGKWYGAHPDDREFARTRLDELYRFVCSTWDIALSGAPAVHYALCGHKLSGRLEVNYNQYYTRTGQSRTEWALSNRDAIKAIVESEIEWNAARTFPTLDAAKVTQLVVRWGNIPALLLNRRAYSDPKIGDAVRASGLVGWYTSRRDTGDKNTRYRDILATLDLEEAWALEYKLGQLDAELNAVHDAMGGYIHATHAPDQFAALGDLFESLGLRAKPPTTGSPVDMALHDGKLIISMERV